ncbi:FUSC family protein [Serinicoccus hydrothermalis]|nr:aromatic acid exporter family protein [Serinicoccus hydrothermalis]
MAWLRRPDVASDLLQVVKSVVAALVAWVLADRVLQLEQAFLAPWTALLTVHATVYRTVSRGAQAVLATTAGVTLAFVAVLLGGRGILTLGIALLVAMLFARVGLLRDEGVTVATTVLFVITTSSSTGPGTLLDRLGATGIGVVVALVVNAALAAPLRDASARRQIADVDRGLGDLLTDMAEGIREGADDERTGEWVERTRALDKRLESAWRLVYEADESRWGNPRQRRRRDDQELSRVLRRLEEGIAQVRGMVRLIHQSAEQAEDWDAIFRDTWTDLLAELGRRVADPEGDVIALREDVDALASRLSSADLADQRWPLYGALIEMSRVVIDIVDDVATSPAVRE